MLAVSARNVSANPGRCDRMQAREVIPPPCHAARHNDRAAPGTGTGKGATASGPGVAYVVRIAGGNWL